MQAILIKPDCSTVEVVNLQHDNLQEYYDLLECDLITFAPAYALYDLTLCSFDGVELICDDEALLKDSPQINLLASLLYGFAQHGQALFGNVLVVNTTADGETVSLRKVQIDVIKSFLSHRK